MTPRRAVALAVFMELVKEHPVPAAMDVKGWLAVCVEKVHEALGTKDEAAAWALLASFAFQAHERRLTEEQIANALKRGFGVAE